MNSKSLNQRGTNTENKTWQYLTQIQGKTVDRASVHDRRRNTLAMQTGEDKDFIHMGEGNTGENNQGLGMMSDQGHKRKGK